MRPLIRLACGLAAGTLLLLTFASVAFAADPILTIDGSGGTSSDGSADANVVAIGGTSRATVTLGADAPATTDGGADGSATVTLGADAPTTASDDVDGSATVTLGADSPATTDDGIDGIASATFGAGWPAADDVDGSTTVTLGADAPSSVGDPPSVGDPTSGVGALSSGLAGLMAFGDTAAEDTTGAVPEAPATDEALSGLSPLFGLLAFGGPGGAPNAPDGSGGSGGSGDAVAAPGEAGRGALPETSTEALASGPGVGFPMLALVLGLLAGGLVARRRSVRSAS
jgi:hypothetical protein